MTFDEVMECSEEYDKKMDAIFEHDEKRGLLTLHVDYPYCIELARIGSMRSLVNWVYHLSSKTWMTSDLIHESIRRILKIKGWNTFDE